MMAARAATLDPSTLRQGFSLTSMRCDLNSPDTGARKSGPDALSF